MRSTKQVVLIVLILAALAFSVSIQLVKADATQYSLTEPYPFISCNAAGDEKLTFVIGESVYVKGGPFWPIPHEVSIYVIPSGFFTSPLNAVAPPVTATVNSSGYIPITYIWTADKIGRYAVWVDANQNRVYDDGDELYHFSYCYLFNVIPEYLTGTIGAVGAMIGSFALYRRRSAKRNGKS